MKSPNKRLLLLNNRVLCLGTIGLIVSPWKFDVLETNMQVLKGHFHAIWQLYKKLEGVFASIEFQN